MPICPPPTLIIIRDEEADLRRDESWDFRAGAAGVLHKRVGQIAIQICTLLLVDFHESEPVERTAA